MGEVDVQLHGDALFLEVSNPQQKVFGQDAAFPCILTPASSDLASLSELVRGIPRHRHEIEAYLRKSGAVLLQGFKVSDPADFNYVLEALNYENFEYTGRGAARTVVIGRVFTTSDNWPLHLPIGFHNEMAYQEKAPSRIIFFCNEQPPEGGGSTPIVPGHIVYEKMAKEMPDFLEQIETKGLIYTKLATETGWQKMFGATTKEEAEERAKELETRIEWRAEGGCMTYMGPRVGVKVDTARCRKVWFNSLGASYEQMLVATPGKVGVTFGDGTPIEEELIHKCKAVMEEEQVLFSWHNGDILIVDNTSVLHARQPSRPPRSILASLCGT